MPRIAATDITPELSEVADLLPKRTLSTRGRPMGEFTETTTPNLENATKALGKAARFIATAVGIVPAGWLTNYAATAKDVVATEAALRIEASMPDRARDDALMDQLGRQAREQREALVETSLDNQPGGKRYWSVPQRNG